MLPSVPGTGILAGKRFLTNRALEAQSSVRIHVSLHLIGRKELLVADVTLEEALSRVHVVVTRQVPQPLEGFPALWAKVGELPIHEPGGDVALLPDILPLQADVVVQAVLVSVVLATLLTAEHFSRCGAAVARGGAQEAGSSRCGAGVGQSAVVDEKGFAGRCSSREGDGTVADWQGGACRAALALHLGQGTGKIVVSGVSVGVGESADVFRGR